MTSDRKTPGLAFWLIVLLAALGVIGIIAGAGVCLAIASYIGRLID